MYFLKCNNCGHLNEVKTAYLIFCVNCNKKLDNNYSNWQTKNPDKTFDDFLHLICISEEDVFKTSQIPKSNRNKGLKYWIGFALAFAIFYAVGQFGGEKIAGIFRKSSFDKEMIEYANEMNEICPMMVDNVTRLDNVINLPGNIFQYNYTLALVKDSINIVELKDYIEPNIINGVKTQPQMKILRDNKVTVNYNYKDKSGEYLFTISVKPDQYE